MLNSESPTSVSARRRTGFLTLLCASVLAVAACAPKGDALYARAAQSLDKGEVRAAVIDLKNLVQDEPQNAKGRALLGQALLQSGNFQAGAIEIQKAKDLGATKDTLLVPDCLVSLAKGEFDKVLSECNPASAPEGARFQLQLAQGRALMGLDRAADAKAQFAAALTVQPDSLDAWLDLASATYASDGLPAAKTLVDKAPESIRSKSAYWMTVGAINMEGGDLVAAEKAYETAVQRAGKGEDAGPRLSALGALAEAQMRQGKVKEAEATTAQLIKAAPENPLVKQLRAQVAAAAGNLDEARTLLEEAVSAMPENYQARTLLGIVNLQQGNTGQAEMHFANVVANQPGNVRVQRLLAETRARSQSPQESLAGLKPALAQPDTDPSLLAMAGRLSLASGDKEGGLAYFARAAAQPAGKDAAKTSPEVQLEIASGYLMAGDLEKGVALLESMPQGGATSYQREYLLMLALLRQGEKDKATAEAKALLQRSGDDPAVRNLAAGVFAAAGQPAAAREQFAAALKLKPKDPETLLNIARLDLAEGKTADAEKSFRSVLDADPKNLIAMFGVASTSAARGDTKEAEKWLQTARADHPESVEAQLALAQLYMGSRDYGKALGVIDAAAKKWPDNAAISNARGVAQMGANDLPGALASFKKATSQAPKAYDYSLNLARAYLASRDLDNALEVLNGVLKAQPKFLPALAVAASASLQAGQLEKATGYVQRLQQAAPDAQITMILEGDLAMAMKRYAEALVWYRKASALGTNRELVLAQYRASVLSGAPQPNKVLADWVAANPKDAQVAAVLAEAMLQQGNTDGAMALYEQALTQAPENPVLLNNLAVLYQSKGDPKAVGTAAKAYQAAPKAAAIQDTYGWILFQTGNVSKAFELLQEALKGLPNSAEVQYHYAAVLAKKGDTAEAIALLKKAVKGQMPANAKADAEKLLQQLSK